MKYYFILLLIFSNSLIPASAQDAYAEQYLGWIKMIDPKTPEKPFKQDNRSYTATEFSLCNTFINWVQLSYIPMGGLGQGKKLINEKLGLYNQYTTSVHKYYGAVFPVYLYLRKDKTGKWVPENNLGYTAAIIANGPVGDHIDLISTPEHYYFYLPEMNKENEEDELMWQYQGFDKDTLLSKYIRYFQPKSVRYLSQYVVILSKENRPPWIAVSKGEFIDQAEKAVYREYLKKIADINNDYREEKFKQENRNIAKMLLDKRNAAIQAMREKYRNRMNEKAELIVTQPSVFLENSPDYFEMPGFTGKKKAVYKYDREMLQSSVDGKPSWIVVRWGDADIQDERFKQLHLAMMKNLNYPYIYNYFFNPALVKGKSYSPLHQPSEKSTAVSALPETITTLPSGYLFKEDFSNTSAGNKPANWKSNNNIAGNPATVQTASGKNWLTLKGNTAWPVTNLQLKDNFAFSCEVAVPKGFAWGAKRLEIIFGKDKASFIVGMRPGFDGRPGFLYAYAGDFGSSIIVPGSLSKVTEVPINGFSNDIALSRFQLDIRKKGRTLEILMNGMPSVTIADAFIANCPAIEGFMIKQMSSDNAADKYFISGISVKNE